MGEGGGVKLTFSYLPLLCIYTHILNEFDRNILLLKWIQFINIKLKKKIGMTLFINNEITRLVVHFERSHFFFSLFNKEWKIQAPTFGVFLRSWKFVFPTKGMDIYCSNFQSVVGNVICLVTFLDPRKAGPIFDLQISFKCISQLL